MWAKNLDLEYSGTPSGICEPRSSHPTHDADYIYLRFFLSLFLDSPPSFAIYFYLAVPPDQDEIPRSPLLLLEGPKRWNEVYENDEEERVAFFYFLYSWQDFYRNVKSKRRGERETRTRHSTDKWRMDIPW